MLLTKESLLKKDKLKIAKVVLNKDEFVFVREMTAKEKDQLEQSMLVNKRQEGEELKVDTDLSDFNSKLAALTMCDEEGNNLLDFEDYKQLSISIGFAKLKKIVDKALELNAMRTQDKEKVSKN